MGVWAVRCGGWGAARGSGVGGGVGETRVCGRAGQINPSTTGKRGAARRSLTVGGSRPHPNTQWHTHMGDTNTCSTPPPLYGCVGGGGIRRQSAHTVMPMAISNQTPAHTPSMRNTMVRPPDTHCHCSPHHCPGPECGHRGQTHESWPPHPANGLQGSAPTSRRTMVGRPVWWCRHGVVWARGVVGHGPVHPMSTNCVVRGRVVVCSPH